MEITINQGHIEKHISESDFHREGCWDDLGHLFKASKSMTAESLLYIQACQKHMVQINKISVD